MAHHITKVQNKNADWKVVSILNAAGEMVDNVSINRTSKKGDVFPGFDEIKEGSKIEGRLWQSDSNKLYLFAPKDSPKREEATLMPPTVSNAEIKNMLTFKVIPALMEILERLPKKGGVEYPPFDEENQSPF